MRIPALMGLLIVQLVAYGSGGLAQDYDYPLEDALTATVIGTPPEQLYRFDAPMELESRRITVFPERDYPDVFWYAEELRYGVMLQDGPAPLAFLVAGTGADYRSSKSQHLARAFYAAGAHVVTLTSPTHINFIVAGSAHARPGRTSDDVADLYRVMRLVRDEIAGEVGILGYHVGGYSMGAFHAAYLAAHDEEVGAFGFDRVLLMNPPVSLLESALRLDAMLLEGVPGGLERFDEFFDRFMRNLSALYIRADRVELAGDFLYRLYQLSEQKTAPETFKALIGISFRFAGLNMTFTSDVMNDFGYVVPKGTRLGVTSSLTDYFKISSRVTFRSYIEDLLIPLVQQEDSSISGLELAEEASLRAIEGFLRDADNFLVVHNADDIILGEGDIAWFEDVFGEHARIYPNGGHMGNIYHRVLVRNLINDLSVRKGAGS